MTLYQRYPHYRCSIFICIINHLLGLEQRCLFTIITTDNTIIKISINDNIRTVTDIIIIVDVLLPLILLMGLWVMGLWVMILKVLCVISLVLNMILVEIVPVIVWGCDMKETLVGCEDNKYE